MEVLVVQYLSDDTHRLMDMILVAHQTPDAQ